MINKNQFSIKNTKKNLHKVGKEWVTVSIAMLGLLAGGIYMTTNIGNADTSQAQAFVQQPQANSSIDKNENDISQQAKTYLRNNEAYDSKSFTNLDGLLTANSWYRPKMIHQNGQNWVPSQPNDYRPILMSWGPNHNIQYNYLNYMHQHNLLSSVPSSNESGNNLLTDYDRIQDNIEHKITQNGNTEWLKSLVSNFVNTVPQWNISSEDFNPNSFQGGSMSFQNSPLTPNSNSQYRLLSREPNNGNNKNDWNMPNNDNLELLLGNDIDNSNPTVQAEDLNNLYYWTHLGTIFANDPSANFDGVREDATYSMDYDVTRLIGQYMNDKYHNPNKYLSIMEDGPSGSSNGQSDINNSMLSRDNIIGGSLEGCLTNNHSNEYTHNSSDMSSLIGFRNYDHSENQVAPNYSKSNNHDDGDLVGAMDNLVNTILSSNHNMSKYQAGEQAAQLYDDDEYNIIKHYGQQYNVPDAYALLLTNKDTIPEVYYGDMYKAYKPYMSTPTPYFNAIQALLEARKKYVSGGQQMLIHDNGHILTSVRFGKDNNGNQILGLGDAQHSNPTSGMAVVINNSVNYNPGSDLKVFMGGAHENQEYRPLILSQNAGNGSNSGLKINDMDPSLHTWTDNQGYLHIPKEYLNGTESPQIMGNLSVWVPVGASNNQDVRSFDYTQPNNGKVFNSNAGLDSHVLMESFSTYLPRTSNSNELADNVVSLNANKLKNWGITDFWFAPHYTPVNNDNSFPDAYMKNGYAFKDRYDVGITQPTKYGNLNNLLNANKALHHNGIHTLVDLVDNQLYNLPYLEAVNATRTDGYGRYKNGSNIENDLYADKTISDPDGLQAKYGGKFLTKLQQLSQYKNLFTENQISTDKPINTNTFIKQWSAKYMNGSNIQGRGAGYILHDNENSNKPSIGDYYIIGKNKSKLPNILVLGDKALNNPNASTISQWAPNTKMAHEDPSLVDDKFVQNYHYNNPEGRSNDIESIVPHYNNDGKLDYWDGYYLWTPNDQGNQWYHYRTNNFSKINPFDPSDPTSINNVAIPDHVNISVDGRPNVEVNSNNKNPLSWGYVASGSVISNSKGNGSSWLTHDTYGNSIDSNAKLAYFSTLYGHNQGIHLAYSNNDNQFHPYSSDLVMGASSVGLPSGADFRDPFVTISSNDKNKLVAYVAGGVAKKMYTMTSTDGIHWTHDSSSDIDLSHIPNNNNYLVETPNIKTINNQPIMFFGCQGGNTSLEHVYYVTGRYNNKGIFQITGNSKYGSIDDGFDNYAGNFSKIDDNHLIYIGWPLNWNVFKGQHIGYFTLPRVISWNNKTNNTNVTPIEPGVENLIKSTRLNKNSLSITPDSKYNINFDTPVNSFNIDLNRNHSTDLDNNISLNFNNGNLTIDRHDDNYPSLNLTKTVDNIGSNNISSIRLYIDNDLIEAYIPEIHKIYTIADLDNTRNTPYKLTLNIPANIYQYKFNLSQAPELGNLNTLENSYSHDSDSVNSLWHFDSTHAKNNDLNSAQKSNKLINSYFDDINRDISVVKSNLSNYNNYNGDARQHIFVALVNNGEDLIKTRLSQVNLQLNNLLNIAKRNGYPVSTSVISYIDDTKLIGTQKISGPQGSKYTGQLNVPQGYKLANQNLLININNNSVVKLMVNPVSSSHKNNSNINDTIQYVNFSGTKLIGTQKISGSQGSKYTGQLNVPQNYKLLNPDPLITFGNNNGVIRLNVSLNSSINSSVIQYINGTDLIGTQKISGPQGSKYTGQLNVPQGYKLVNQNPLINLDNSIVKLAVSPVSLKHSNNSNQVTSGNSDVMPSSTNQNNSNVITNNYHNNIPSVNPTSSVPSADLNNSVPESNPTIQPASNNQSFIPTIPNTPIVPSGSFNVNSNPDVSTHESSNQPVTESHGNNQNNNVANGIKLSTTNNKERHNIHRPIKITLKSSFTTRITGGQRITLPKNYDLRVTKTIHKYNKPYYVARFNRESILVPIKVAKVIRYANTASYPRWINISRSVSIKKSPNGKSIKNLHRNTLRVVGVANDKRGNQLYKIQYNKHYAYITANRKYVYGTYLRTLRKNFVVHINRDAMIYNNHTNKSHSIYAGKDIKVKNVFTTKNGRTRLSLGDGRYITGNKYYVNLK